MGAERIESLVRELLIEIGEDPGREGLVKTPQRVAAALKFLTSGSRTDAAKLITPDTIVFSYVATAEEEGPSEAT